MGPASRVRRSSLLINAVISGAPNFGILEGIGPDYLSYGGGSHNLRAPDV